MEAENDTAEPVQAKEMQGRLKDTKGRAAIQKTASTLEARIQRLKSNLNATFTRCKMNVSIFLKKR